jgi:phospholipid transport system substrate-binding protein
MTPTRRTVLAGLGLALAAPAAARAVEPAEATAFIEKLTSDLTAILKRTSATDARVDEFLSLFRRTTALPDIGRFTMGLNWRSMSEGQQQRFLDAFERYAARVYVARIGEYTGQTIEVDSAQDVGRKGVLVKSTLKTPGAEDVAVEWLVNDRSGELQLVDIIAEGVSLAITQREEFAAMVDKRNGDIDRFISDLDSL